MENKIQTLPIILQNKIVYILLSDIGRHDVFYKQRYLVYCDGMLDMALVSHRWFDMISSSIDSVTEHQQYRLIEHGKLQALIYNTQSRYSIIQSLKHLNPYSPHQLINNTVLDSISRKQAEMDIDTSDMYSSDEYIHSGDKEEGEEKDIEDFKEDDTDEPYTLVRDYEDDIMDIEERVDELDECTTHYTDPTWFGKIVHYESIGYTFQNIDLEEFYRVKHQSIDNDDGEEEEEEEEEVIISPIQNLIMDYCDINYNDRDEEDEEVSENSQSIALLIGEGYFNNIHTLTLIASLANYLEKRIRDFIYLPHLKHIHVISREDSSDEIYDEVWHLVSYNNFFKANLETIYINTGGGQGVDAFSLENFFNHSPYLTTLSMASQGCIKKYSHMERLCKAIKENKTITNLKMEDIDFDFSEAQVIMLAEAFSQNDTIQSLVLKGNTPWLSIGTSLPRNLTKLRINIGMETKSIFEVVKVNHPTLTYIKYFVNQNDYNMDLLEIEATEAFQANTTIKKVKLSSYHKGSMLVDILTKVIKSHPSIDLLL